MFNTQEEDEEVAQKNFQTVSNNMLVNPNHLMQNQNFGIRVGKKRPMTTKNVSGAAVTSQKKMQLLSYGAGSNKQSSQSGAFLFKMKKRDKSGESEEGTQVTGPLPQGANNS